MQCISPHIAVSLTTSCRGRSNHHNVGADLARDIERKRKIHLLLGLTAKDLVEDATPISAAAAAATTAAAAAAAAAAAVVDSDADSGDDHEGLAEGWREGPVEAPPNRGTKRRKLSKERASQQDFDDVFLGTLKKTANIGPTAVPDVDDLLPTRAELPNSRMGHFAFADRLGCFITGEERLAGTYPLPPDGEVVVFEQARLRTATARSMIRATRNFRGQPRYDFVEVRGENNVSWYGQVVMFFSYREDEEYLGVALINYLTRVPSIQRQCPSKVGFEWTSAYPDCVDVRNIIRPVVMLRVPWLRGRVKGAPQFVLIDHLA